MLFSHSLLWTQKIMILAITVMTIIMGDVWIIRRVLNWIYWHLTHTTSGLQAIHRYRWSTHFTVHRSVFTSRILATDLRHSHWNFKSYMKTSFHNVIPFLPLFCNCQLNSIPPPPSSHSGRVASRNSTNSNDLLCPFYNSSAQTTQKTQPLYCWEGVIVASVCVAAGMCLPSISDFTLPAFGHVSHMWPHNNL
jgi:hypothetical protein